MFRRTTAALTLLALAVLAGAVLAPPAAASHGDDNTNFTVYPGDREPGASDATYRLELEWTAPATGNAGMDDVDTVEFAVQNVNIEACGESDVFGTPYTLSVDDGEEVQELDVTDSTWEGNAVAFAIADGSPRFRVGHTVILELDGCVQNGDEEDWFQAAGKVEGPAITEGQDVTLEGISHYFGVCEGCESDADARESLGDPPSEPTPTPTPTATPAATDTPTPTRTASPATSPPPTRTETPDPTATPTDTPTATTADGDTGDGQPTTRDPADAEVLGLSPMAVVGVVAVVSLALAALGARRL